MKKQMHTRYLLPICFISAAVIWLLYCGGFLLRDVLRIQNGTLATQTLHFYDSGDQYGLLAPASAEEFDKDPWFITTDPDPQLIFYFPDGQVVNQFVFSGNLVGRGSGEMAVYYTETPNDSFSEEHKIWAQKSGDNSWVFDLHGKNVYSLRFDPASLAGVYWQVDSMTLNPEVSALSYFVPDALEIAFLLIGPIFAWAVLLEIYQIVSPLLQRRRFDTRWENSFSGKDPS